MALLHGYPLGLIDHSKWTSQVRNNIAVNVWVEQAEAASKQWVSTFKRLAVGEKALTIRKAMLQLIELCALKCYD